MAKAKIKSGVRKVDAEMALSWLARTEELGFHNRKLRNATIVRYVNIIKTGHWLLNGESVILDKEGALLNGQHRMHAVLEAFSDGGSVEMLVVEGVDRATFRTMDQGLRRNMSDILDIDGIANGNSMAALLRHIRVWQTNRFSNRKVGAFMDNSELAEIAQGNLEEWKACLSYGKKLSREFGKPSHWAFIYWLFNECFPEEAMDQFLVPLDTGANLAEGHPILTLRRKMIKAKSNRFNYDPKLVISMAVRTWNAVQEGRTMAMLPTSKLSDPVPKMIGED